MPYNVVDGGILEVTVKGLLAAQVTMSVFHYKLTGTFGIADGDAEINAFDLEFNDAFSITGAYAASCAIEQSLTDVFYQWVYPTRYHRVRIACSPNAGSVAGGVLPPNVSGAITKRGDLGTRHSIGTLHMPGVPLVGVVAGNMTADQLARYNGLAGLLPLRRRTDTLVPVIYNRQAPALSVAITASSAQPTSRVERRRTVGLGI